MLRLHVAIHLGTGVGFAVYVRMLIAGLLVALPICAKLASYGRESSNTHGMMSLAAGECEMLLFLGLCRFYGLKFEEVQSMSGCIGDAKNNNLLR